MVKRYGSAPLLTEPMEHYGNNLESLRYPRNTEKDIYNFINKEMEEAYQDLPNKWTGEERFRATKHAALALKSRLALYAASIAKYGFLAPNYKAW